MNEPLFWQRLRQYRDVERSAFLCERWQLRNSLRSAERLYDFIRMEASQALADDFAASLAHNPMQVRLTPYVLALIDWQNAASDPLRRQFIPLASEYVPDHPALALDSLSEHRDSPVPGVVHRYPGKALLLATRSCPVYCRFCTRSYLVGGDTAAVTKAHEVATPNRWQQALTYIRDTPAIEDVVVSGGDAYNLPARHLWPLLEALLNIKHVRRVRVASKALAVLPCALLDECGWSSALIAAQQLAREQRKQFSLQTHFNHAREITWITRLAADALFDRGIRVRNQTVLLRGVNDEPQGLGALLEALVAINVEPYYVYLHDLVPGSETLRTPLSTAIRLEEALRGRTSGYEFPRFVVDLPGGGGKRHVCSFRHYDPGLGVSLFRAPAIDPERRYYHFDPLPAQASHPAALSRLIEAFDNAHPQALAR
ncbi:MULTISPECIES: KamA family radical SAM protein [unclassified Pseudomonas]|uniref:KamA family radical SAM protein n=1 Tax=unclassified Pseudomonas TaxID=196821 RepID=UPI000BD439A2|nr:MULTISPECIES: KamA family radical SAM protein [unclassified Pseudomonas]PVZ13897.1 lysine 2,3-aminomutase [Pseudomonas sp. URIL14HWK12:I12]PVZ24203.1 lysine 2,3-aminomutase [Pseudomonas sp. URIL14HWK12:I10]PVZ33158.1 lysine 2,3-aminomutase [Pseudomonas sp. URIL14HWK12:I11]SNZ10556.1 lysine 2,3-aminomutase [Pseudomonas sp. URIL14HWK12:I9]